MPGTSLVKMTKKKKAKMKVSSEAVKIAKMKNDPLYDLYMKYKRKIKAIKKKILKKYGTKAMSKVRKSMGIAVKSWD